MVFMGSLSYASAYPSYHLTKSLMLSSCPIAPTLPMTDVERTKVFYREILGLPPLTELPEILMFRCGDGTVLTLYQREASKADHTLASFLVKDIEKEVAELRAKGVVFEEYDRPDIKTINGIATRGHTKAAWFRDPNGNIIGLTQESTA